MSFFKALRDLFFPARGASPGLAPAPSADQQTDALIAALSAPSAWARKSAAEALKQRKSPSALPALINALRDVDAGVRAEAARALMWMGEPAQAAIPALLKACCDPEPSVREAAVSSLASGWIRPSPGDVRDTLLDRLRHDPHAPVRREALVILGSFFPALSPASSDAILAAIDDPDEHVRKSALYYAECSSSSLFPSDALRARAAAAAARWLPSREEEVRYRAAMLLNKVDPSSLDVLPALLDALLSKQVYRVQESIRRLSAMPAPAVEPRLLAMLRGSPFERSRGAIALLGWPAHQGAAVEILCASLAGGAAELRRSVAETIRMAGPPEPTRPALQRALRGALIEASDEDTQVEVLRALSSVPPAERPTIELLLVSLRSARARVREAGAEALGRLCKDAAVALPPLRRALSDPDRSVRYEAARVIGWFGKEAAEAVPDMVSLLERDADAASYLLYPLSCIGPAAQAAVPRLVELLLTHREASRRDGAAEALAGIGIGAFLAQPGAPARLGAAFRDESEAVRRHLAGALSSAGEAAGPLVPALASLLDDTSSSVRSASLRALTVLGPVALPAQGALLARLCALDDGAAAPVLAALVAQRSPPPEDAMPSLAARLPGAGRSLAAGVLRYAEPAGAGAVPLLLAGVDHPDEVVCEQARAALRRLGVAALEALEASLQGAEVRPRLRAIEAMGHLGGAARDALERAARSEDEDVRMQALIALDGLR